MFPVTNKDFPAGSSSRYDTPELEGVVDSRKGLKPSLAERNRERQQRFRQRQKSRIEELESRCQRLTAQARALAAEKEDLANNVSLLKNLVQVRDLQLVSVTSQLAQHMPSSGEVKLEISSLESSDIVEGAPRLSSNSALEAIHTARREAQVDVAHPQARLVEPQAQDGPSSADTNTHEAVPAPLRNSSPASGPPRNETHSPQLALDQLCRVAEMAEMQQAESSPPTATPPTSSEPDLTPPLPRNIAARLSSGFEAMADVLLNIEGQLVSVHSAFLAAHSDFFAKQLQELRHSQPLFRGPREPIRLDSGLSGKRLQDVLRFVSHCYGALDLSTTADGDVMRLIMLAEEYGASTLLRACDETIVARADKKDFSYFVELSQGGDIVDWIRLAARLGLKGIGGLCETHLAKYLKGNRSWRENARLNELGQDCLLRVIDKLAEL